ncbi:tetratricopeptide repeat protein [Teredinibacter sp. KSP-S5-2]|uniref:tetratricopeptide repeat protein n=1 Tax=Teredinibacter sp. KSP-S5-2 TaxID=3034506 RepID=UPI002935005B|nr:tetratricopeptide repeat protein [Teredinibacter sp. KSP-S5-2]WNO10595.1 tetratricopeptide repeat protein [Teredinibacter sp. KSP-S5-2]
MNNYIITLILFCSLLLQACDKYDNNHIETNDVEGGFQSQDEGKPYSEANNSALSKATKLIQEEKYVDAIKIYGEIIDQSPNEYAAYHGLGTAYFYLNDFALAKSNYEKAISLNSKLSYSYAGLGVLAKESENYTEAIHHYSTAISINKKFALAYYGRASTYEDINEYNRAANDYNEVIKLAPNSSLSQKAKQKLVAIKNLTSQSTRTW